MADFDRALVIILRMEVAPDGTTYSNRPDDAGGPTNYGITHLTYFAFLRDHGWPKRGNCECGNPAHSDVRLITQVEVRTIYEERYWSSARCQEMPWPVCLVVFDHAVNGGPSVAIQILQRTIGVLDDGVIGPKTRAVLQTHALDPVLLATRYLLFRAFAYRNLVKKKPDNTKNLIDFWLPRLRHMVEEMT